MPSFPQPYRSMRQVAPTSLEILLFIQVAITWKSMEYIQDLMLPKHEKYSIVLLDC